jgi:hypothetical protein
MNRILLALAVAALPLAACQKSPDVTYQDRAVQTAADTGARRESPAARTTTTQAKAEQAPALPRAPLTAVERFQRDFGNEGRFVHARGFRLDTWTGCVTDGRTGVPVMDNQYQPECGYTDRAPRKD